jgi:integrase
MAKQQGNRLKGIEVRHARSCRSHKGKRCDCEPTYRPWIWTREKRIRGKATDSIAGAQAWRKDAQVAVRRDRPVRTTAPTLCEAGEAWLEQARRGVIRARRGHRYKPASIRGYERALRLRAYPALGTEPLDEITRADMQELVDGLVADGLAATTVEQTVNAIRAVYRHEIKRDRIKDNPTRGVTLPSGDGGEKRACAPGETRALIAAVPKEDRAIWATAFYAGLRRGELMALRDDAIDLDAGVIRAEAGWDDKEGRQPTKGREERTVPITSELRAILVAHRLRTGRRGEALVFGATEASPFEVRALGRRADRAWRAAGLARVTLHVGRHTFGSTALAAGVNVAVVSKWLGHSNITVTLNIYRHLLEGEEQTNVERFERFLATAGAAP